MALNMEDLYVYYYGSDRSHCGSCWEADDEELVVMITDIWPEKMKEHFTSFVYTELMHWKEKYNPVDFLKDVRSYADGDHEHIDKKPEHFCIYFEMNGRTYPPDFEGYYIKEEHDVEKLIVPEELLGKKEWDEVLQSLVEVKEKRIENEKKKEEKRVAKAKKKKEYDDKLKEFNEFQKLKEKWDGKEMPEKPLVKKNKFEKFMEEYKKLNEDLKIKGLAPLKDGGGNG
ncbi:hypothetical protein N9948_00335 [bacterium]|nr:hypothetical protein [bacterium]